MKTKFSQDGRTFLLHDADKLTVLDKLPPAVYLLSASQEHGLFLKQTDTFDLPPKMYGSVAQESQRVLYTFNDRPGITGVLLVGERGSGKSMLAKKISIDAMALGMPVILVNNAYPSAMFNAFVQNIQQEAVFFLDEFEKTHDAAEQAAILTLLDGVIKTKKLFLLTSNSKYKVNEHMQNRPGRIYYMKEYKGIDINFIREYAADNLKPELQSQISSIVRYSTMFNVFNFDMLKAIVEEMNRFNEPLSSCIAFLNASPQFSAAEREYNIAVFNKDGEEISTFTWSGSPFFAQDETRVTFSAGGYHTPEAGRLVKHPRLLLSPADQRMWAEGKRTDEMQNVIDDAEYMETHFRSRDMTDLNEDGSMRFQNEDGYIAILRRKQYTSFDASAYAG